MYRLRRRVGGVIRLLLSLGLIYLVVSHVEWAVLTPILKAADVRMVLIASCLTPVLFCLLGVRWTMFLRARRLRLSLWSTVRLTWAGQFFNSVLPGSIGGDAVKLYEVLQRFPDARVQAASTIILDRLCALIALAVFAIGGLLRDAGPISAIQLRRVPGVFYGVVACLLLVAAAVSFIVGKELARGVFNERLKTLGNVLISSFCDLRSFIAGIVLSCVIHGFNFYIGYLFARALGYQISYGQILLMLPVIMVLLLLPVTINGHGLREMLLISYFVHFGVLPTAHLEAGAREAAVAFSLVLVANDLLWALPGGLVYLLRSKNTSSVGLSLEDPTK